MHLIHCDDILVPTDRIRKEFDVEKHRELRESISKSGLFHPILLRPDGRTLIAGERRLRVLREIYFEGGGVIFDNTEYKNGQIPAVVMGETDELHYLEAEFTENARRSALTWQEETAYIHRYHVLQKEIKSKHTQGDTMRELGYSKTGSAAIGNSIVLAPFLSDPEIQNAKTRDEGLKILERRFEQSHREAIAKTLGTTLQSSLHTLLQGDLRQILSTLPEAHFDCIIADPPYGVNAHKWDNMSAVQHAYLDTPEYSDELYKTIIREGFRVSKPQSHIYLFCEFRRFGEIFNLLEREGWRAWFWPLIFNRGSTNGVCPWPEHGPRRTYECIAYAIKGDRRVNGIYPDILDFQDTSGTERGAHKPTELYENLISRSCSPGDRILDPCIGTGSIFTAGTRRSIQITGIEIEAAAYQQASERMK